MAKFNINGKVHDVQVEGDTPLLWVIRPQAKAATVVVTSPDFGGGVGAQTICAVGPSVMNAIHAETGRPLRSLRLKNLKLV